MDYKALGLKCGIEIHQQLEGKKLFCQCPTTLRDDTPDFTIHRKIRASAGESGTVDVAAAQEHARSRTFIYEGYNDTTCLVETDSEPPHELNQDALYTTLQFSQLVQAETTSIVQFMRKTVVDGSNTSGFQRTALIATNGNINTSQGNVKIDNINLEEDAAKIVSESTDEKTYRLDRLGIPLIEIGTAPDITSPEQCQETAKKIGMLLRSLPGVKRGLGTIRQDINVSIAGGSRIEIKGAQDLKQLPLLVELEATRQRELLKIKQELAGVKLNPLEIVDVSAIFKDSASKIIVSTLKNHGKILGMKLNGFSGFLGRELQPGLRLGTECSQRAKIQAGVGGIFHSDELPAYGITEHEVKRIRSHLKCGTKDAFILVADSESKSRKALDAVYARAQEVLRGVPAEVRKANADGTTSYLRPMPGMARMYPETDIPLIFPDVSTISIPEILEEKIQRYQHQFSLSADLATFVAKSDKTPLFEELTVKYPSIKPAFIAETLTSTLLDIQRQYKLDPDNLTDGQFRQVFQYLAEEKIHKDIMLDVLMDLITGKFELKKYTTLGTEKIHATLKRIIADNPNAPFSALMGLAMKQLGGKASGKFISDELKKLVK